MFYICAMDHLPFIQHDEKEMSFAVWSTPKHLIKDHVNCKLWLAPPQFYEMSRLLRFENFHCLMHSTYKALFKTVFDVVCCLWFLFD